MLVINRLMIVEGWAVIKMIDNDEWRGIEAYSEETEEFGCSELYSPTNSEVWE